MPSRALTRFCSRRGRRLPDATLVIPYSRARLLHRFQLGFMSGPAGYDQSLNDQPRAALPVYVVAFRRASAPFQGLQMARRRRASTSHCAMSYRIQQIRSLHRRMSPVVTGLRPISKNNCISPCPNRTGYLFSLHEVEAGDYSQRKPLGITPRPPSGT